MGVLARQMCGSSAAPQSDVVSDACQLLTLTYYCASQARSLRKCYDAGGACGAQEEALNTCAKMREADVVRTLAAVASKKCPSEVRAFEFCKDQSGERACKGEDMAAMMCAARNILEASKKPK